MPSQPDSLPKPPFRNPDIYKVTTIDIPEPSAPPTASAIPAPPRAVQPPPPAASPLSPEHFAQLELAKTRAKKIRRAIAIAATDAWITAIFAALAVLGSLVMFSVAGICIGLAVSFVAYNSFRGHRVLKNLDARGPRLLGYNQLLLAASITVYALYCIYDAAHNPGEFAAYLANPQLAGALGPMNLGSLARLEWLLTLTVYIAVIAATLVAQGLTALYYFTRAKHLRAYREATPAWILDLQRKTAD